MRYGLLLPSSLAQLRAGGSAASVVETAAAAERGGFDSVWVGDSLVRPRLEPMTLLASIAQRTSTVMLGTALLMPAYRHPVQAAATISTVDQLSGGRLVVGVGAGFPGFSEQELALVGVDYRTRFTRLDETVALWRELWTSSPSSVRGRTLDYEWLPEVPRPAQDGGPPIWLGGITSAALRRTAAHYDGWMPYPPDPADYAAGLATIRQQAGGRPITPALYATVYIDDDQERGVAALDRFCRAGYLRPYDEVSRIQVMCTGPDVAAQLGTFVAAGVEHIIIRIGALEPDVIAGQLTAAAGLVATLRSTEPATEPAAGRQ
jgi:alkanesulfonate monooxygenase SsuD/methylene tetrahydromethanopterin reductase-like flavin-dependent oxidoreductase (luciferase family)